jgi:hypothetical protein
MTFACEDGREPRMCRLALAFLTLAFVVITYPSPGPQYPTYPAPPGVTLPAYPPAPGGLAGIL